MKSGDLVREKSPTIGKPKTGIVLAVDLTQKTGAIMHPYQVCFSNGDVDWMRPGFLEVINESR